MGAHASGCKPRCTPARLAAATFRSDVSTTVGGGARLWTNVHQSCSKVGWRQGRNESSVMLPDLIMIHIYESLLL